MKVINKNSKKANNHEPSASTMTYGEIAVNYNSDNPRLLIKDSSNKIVGFPSEKQVNSQFTTVNNTINNIKSDVNENSAGIETINNWIATPLSDSEIDSCFV